MSSLKHIWRLASINQSAGRAGPHAEKGAEKKNIRHVHRLRRKMQQRVQLERMRQQMKSVDEHVLDVAPSEGGSLMICAPCKTIICAPKFRGKLRSFAP